MGIGALGVGSGLALEDLVRQLVQAERAPREASIRERQQQNEVSISGYSKLSAQLSALQDSLSSLSDTRSLNARSVSFGGDEENQFITGTASSSAAAGTYQVSVEQLAQGSKAKSGAFANSTDALTTTASNLTFATNNGEQSFSIAVDAGASLQDIAAAVNSSSENYGVTASIINTGGTNPETRLVFSSSVTGAENELVVSNDNAELDGLSTVATGAGPAGMTIAAEDQAQDAILEIDGITTYSSSNTFSNAIEGLSLEVTQANPGVTQTMTVGTDKEGVKEQLTGFVEKYNSFVTEVNKLTSANPEGTSGALLGDSTVRGLMNGINNIIGGSVASADASMNTLYSLGIAFGEDGLLEVDSDRMDSALENNFDGISKLFSNEDGIGVRLDGLADQYTRAGGVFSSREDIFTERKESLTKEKEDFDRYMASYEQTLRQRYASLDETLAGLNRTSDYLAGQLANLPGFSGSSN
ncbi:flagellar hook protein [Thalassospira xiamenensis]|nr:flagellar hook protein [Thalassospira xiamenensis]